MQENTRWQHNPKWNGKFSWINTSFLLLTPVLTVILIPLYVWNYGFTWADFFLLLAMTLATGISITAGYHRLFAHQTYESHSIVRFFYLAFGAAALQNSAYKWASDHRYHHRFVDKEGDPYSIKKGFFYAHMGWIFQEDPTGRSFANIQDLEKDTLVRWQHQFYLWIAVVVGFGLPTLVGLLYGRPLAGFLWGGLFRTVFVHHGTFFINSAAHVFGTQPYSRKNTARDCWWLAFFTNGEGYHNFHHAFANDYRNGIRWYDWDPSKWLIQALHRLGLANNLQKTPEAIILKAKLEADHDLLQEALEKKPSDWRKQMQEQLEAMKVNLDKRIEEFQRHKREFQVRYETAKAARDRRWYLRKQVWNRKLKREKRALELALREYKRSCRMALQA